MESSVSNIGETASGISTEQLDQELHSAQEEDKKIYELQLTQLQEQLVAAMIENQNLGNYRHIIVPFSIFHCHVFIMNYPSSLCVIAIYTDTHYIFPK